MSVVQPAVKRSAADDQLASLGQLIWDYVELVVIITAAIVGPAGVALVVGLPWLIAMVCVAVFMTIVIVLFGTLLLRLHQHGGARRRRRNFVRQWPDFCDRLGWSQRLQVHAGVRRPEETPAQVPDLVAFEADDRGAQLIIKPLSSQPRAKWPTMADALARDRGYPHQRWFEPHVGHLQIDLISTELPTIVHYSDQLHVRGEWDRIPIAIDAAGQLVCWTVSEVPHLLVGGTTQGGKGSVIRCVMMHCLQTGWQVIPLNPKGSGEFGWSEDLGVPVVTEIAKAAQVMKWVELEMARRQRIVGKAKVNNRTRLPNPDDLPPLMLIVDEGSALLTPNKANKEMAKQQLLVADVLTRVAMQGRSVGLHLLLAAQRPDVQHLGPAGGQLRMNMDARIAVCDVDGDGKRMMFDNDDPDILRNLNGTKGRAVITKLSAGSNDIFPAQVIYADEEDLNDNPPTPMVTQLAGSGMPLVSAGRLADEEDG